MHIEPGIVNGAKIVLSYGTAAATAAYALKSASGAIKLASLPALAARSAVATMLVFVFFQVLPHFAVGVSEVHFILGSTLFLILGAGPAAIGLAAGLLLQGVFFAPLDLPQYAMNVTTLLVPLFAMRALAARIIAPNTAYVDLSYKQALALSTTYQGGVVVWVGFWAIYGAGLGAENLGSIATFGAAYMLVVLIEPLIDLAVLAGAKSINGLAKSGLTTTRLFTTA